MVPVILIRPPPPGVAESYQLVGDPGKKNGEKKLRGLLNKTPEWNCSAVREAEAVKAEARPGNESRDLAVALRAKSCASLRKCHLLRCAPQALRAPTLLFPALLTREPRPGCAARGGTAAHCGR